METIARQGYTEKQIIDALKGRSGSSQVKFRFDVIRNGAKIKEVSATGSVSLNRFANIKRTGKFAFIEQLDWLHDELKPYMLLKMDDSIVADPVYIMPCYAFDSLTLTASAFDSLNITGEILDKGFIGTETRKEEYVEFPLGVFILSSVTKKSVNGLTQWNVEAYDHTVILKEDCISTPLYISAGTKYIDIIQSVLLSANAQSVLVQDASDSVLPSSREFEVGTAKLSIVNTLLGEINFNSIECDSEGRFVISKYTEPSSQDIDFAYKADELSIIGRDTSCETDYYNAPNVFIAVCSNPELDQDYRSVWINDSPTSVLSTVSRGRSITSEIYQPSNITSQSVLDAYIRRIAFESNQIYEHLAFKTALNPLHGSRDLLDIRHPDVSGAFMESSWTLVLSAEGEMTHEARRLVAI